MRIRWRGFELPTRVEKSDGSGLANYAKFHAEPFERGFATTIGNGLRRVLLSSIQGAAVRSIRLQGANNEFTSLDGVFEDVTTVILNIKRLRLRLHSDENVVIRLEKATAGPVTAGDADVDRSQQEADVGGVDRSRFDLNDDLIRRRDRERHRF